MEEITRSSVTRKRVGIAMSGGVDSTICALLLKDHYETTGFFMQLAQPDMIQQVKRVKDIASRIGIELHIIDLRRQFQQKILACFTRSYFYGLTPNPCMICNKEIKFGLCLDVMLAAGMNCVATGHYARIDCTDGLYHLYKGSDPDKDQSYFLARLTQEQLSRILFPLGDMTKKETYVLAQQMGFMDFEGRESQDVCFLDDQRIGDYLEKNEPTLAATGPIVTADGRVLGQHHGLFRYTIGQRKGLGLPDATPWYVLAIEREENRIVVGKEDALYRDCIMIRNIHWLAGRLPEPEINYQVRIRYSHPGADAAITMISDDCCRIIFNEKQRAITPGQFAVIYKDNEVIGSGEIIRELC
jgi:tRNA-uridine 2-sulfurtransferase